ncbi:hypothetical protein JHW43_007372 [Diplocarpon mali]|nr:hypothetical protein JHW43_007372 [Diplocarpon mali]
MVCNSPKCTVRGHGVPPALVCQNTTLPTLNPSVKAVPMTGVRCSTCAASDNQSSDDDWKLTSSQDESSDIAVVPEAP